MPFLGVFVVGWRGGALRKLVAEYKYQSVRAAGEVLAELLDAAIPKAEELMEKLGEVEIVVVPLPTIAKHVRARGLDHTLSLAKKLAKRRGWKVERVLRRAADTVQVGAKQKEREAQAGRAYEVCGKVEAEKVYLLLDDVWTTGASMLAAAEVMRRAGARRMLAGVVETGRPEPKKEDEDMMNGEEKEVSGIETGK